MNKYIYIFLLIISTFLFAEGRKSISVVIDVNTIEQGIEKLKESIQLIDKDRTSTSIHLKKDPFIPLTISNKKFEEQKLLELTLSGIITDGRISMAIINDDVKKEGEFIGSIQVYKILSDRVLLKEGKDVVPLYIQ
ncbi:MAG: hypothetical protein N3D17_02355 [bacterium]|nr:hypothetical protein [bacterium]